ncbi:hypothetical protein MYU51_015433 [Penicillium brevicompactum]
MAANGIPGHVSNADAIHASWNQVRRIQVVTDMLAVEDLAESPNRPPIPSIDHWPRSRAIIEADGSADLLRSTMGSQSCQAAMDDLEKSQAGTEIEMAYRRLLFEGQIERARQYLFNRQDYRSAKESLLAAANVGRGWIDQVEMARIHYYLGLMEFVDLDMESARWHFSFAVACSRTPCIEATNVLFWFDIARPCVHYQTWVERMGVYTRFRWDHRV